MRSSGERTHVYISIYRDSESTRGGSLTFAPIIMAQATSHSPCSSNCTCTEGLHFSAFHYSRKYDINMMSEVREVHRVQTTSSSWKVTVNSPVHIYTSTLPTIQEIIYNSFARTCSLYYTFALLIMISVDSTMFTRN